MNWLSFDTVNCNFCLHDTEDEAKKEAELILESYRDDAYADGWPESLNGAVGYGHVVQSAAENVIAHKEDFTDEEWEDEGYSASFDEILDYKMKATSGKECKND